MKRRDFIEMSAIAASGAMLLRGTAGAQDHTGHASGGVPPPEPAPAPPVKRGPVKRVFPGGQPAVVTPNGTTLPWKTVKGTKVGHLIAMPVEHEFAPGLRAECWGYNGRTTGPTIEAVEGDRVRIYVTNRLPEPTTVHWHGVVLPNGMDGVSGLNQKPIEPGQTFKYEYTFQRPGTFMYHPHFDEMTQMALGMMGMIVVHPRRPRGPRVDRDFALLTSEWSIDVGARRPDPNSMDFNLLTFNSKAFPGTEPLVVGKDERVRIRIGNLSGMDHHPIHLHGYSFNVTATDGGHIPAAGQWPETTVLVPVGSTRDVEFVADAPGDWAMHCHMTHHVMNQMGHDVPIMLGADARRIDRRVQAVVPAYMSMGHHGMGNMGEMKMPIPENSIPMRGGKGPFSHIDMGGMFTIVKVRENPEREDGTGWYEHPKGTVADTASAQDLEADGIDPNAAG